MGGLATRFRSQRGCGESQELGFGHFGRGHKTDLGPLVAPELGQEFIEAALSSGQVGPIRAIPAFVIVLRLKFISVDVLSMRRGASLLDCRHILSKMAASMPKTVGFVALDP